MTSRNSLRFGIGELGSVIRSKPALGNALKSIIPLRNLEGRSFGYSDDDPFVVDLSSEADLIPYVLVHVASAYHDAPRFLLHGRMRGSGEFSQIVKNYLSDKCKFLEIANDRGFSALVRASAGIICLGWEGSEFDEALWSEVFDLIKINRHLALIPSVLSVLSPAVKEGVGPALSAVNECISFSRDCFSTRSEFEYILSDWREITSAPVNANLSSEIWK